MLKRFSKAVAVAVLLAELSSVTNAYAAKAPKGPGPLVTKTNTTKVVHVANVGGNSVNVNMYCYKQAGGKVTKVGKYKYFLSYSKLLKEANQALKNTSNTKTKNKLKKQKALYKVLKADGALLCATAGLPSHTLAKYTGPFGLKQAQRLVEVFALGGRPGLADYYVSIGLDAAIEDLTTFKPDLEVDNFRARLACGSHPWQPEQDTCFENGNPNDFYMDGFIAGLQWRMMYSRNPAFMKLGQFLLDERAPANPRVLNGRSRWMFPEYMLAVDRFMMNGDYKKYVAEVVGDRYGGPAVHAMWLSGARNHLGFLKIGNEDFARESLELLTTGTRKPDGSPVYNDLDVYENSKVMSGLGVSTSTDGFGNEIDGVGFVPAFRHYGPKRLFGGTPHEMVIETPDDFAREIFIKQRDQVAYELAWRLWRRHISPNGSTGAHLQLAQVIKDNDFKLWPALRAMMASQAFYAPENYKTILKDPNTFYVTAARMAGIPDDDWYTVSYYSGQMGMSLGRPPSVFGFNYQNRQLNSDFYQLIRHNALVSHFIYIGLNELEERFNWTPHSGLIAGMPLTGNPGHDVATEILKRMNLTDSWNPSQKDALEHFITYYLSNTNPNDPDAFLWKGEFVKWVRNAPDLGDIEEDFYRIRMAYWMAATSPAFAAM